MVSAGDVIRATDLATAWSTSAITIESGWDQVDTFSTRDLAIRLEGDVAVMTGGILERTSSGLAVAGGSGYNILTVSSAYRPPSLTYVDNGGIGVAGTIGSCDLWIDALGVIQFIPLVASGTISTAGGFGNSVRLPSMFWRVS